MGIMNVVGVGGYVDYNDDGGHEKAWYWWKWYAGVENLVVELETIGDFGDVKNYVVVVVVVVVMK